VHDFRLLSLQLQQCRTDRCWPCRKHGSQKEDRCTERGYRWCLQTCTGEVSSSVRSVLSLAQLLFTSASAVTCHADAFPCWRWQKLPKSPDPAVIAKLIKYVGPAWNGKYFVAAAGRFYARNSRCCKSI